MKRWKHILFLCAVLTALLCVTAYATDNAMSVQIREKPTVSDGRTIGVETLDGLKEIVVPVQVSLEAPAETMFFALFYGGDGKFVGGGMTAATVDSQTSFVIMPIQTNVTGAETLKMLVTDTNFRPLSDTPEYSLTGGGGGGGSYVSMNYYANANAAAVSENGGTGYVYVSQVKPTEGMTLPQMSENDSKTFSRIDNRSVYFYVVFTPGENSAFQPPTLTGSGTLGEASVINAYSANGTAVKSYVFRVVVEGSTSPSSAPTVTVSGTFTGTGSGGSSGGGGGGSYVSMNYYANANAAAVSENGGTGYVYVSQVKPTEGMTLPQMSENDSKTFSHMNNRSVYFYVVFTPGENSVFLEPPTLTGSGTLGEVSVINAYSANGTAVKSYVFRVVVEGSTSPSSAPTVTVSGTFTGTGGGGSEPARGV